MSFKYLEWQYTIKIFQLYYTRRFLMINKKYNKLFKEVVTYDLDKMKYSCDDIF